MTAQDNPYVRVYYRIIDDPKFEKVFDDKTALGWWLTLLMGADAMYPAPATLPRRIDDEVLTKLVDAGLIDLLTNDRYRVHGLAAERDKRHDQAVEAGKKRAENAAREGGKFTSANQQDTSDISSVLPAVGGDAGPAVHQRPPALRSSPIHSDPSKATPSLESKPPARASAPARGATPKNDVRLTKAQLDSWANFGHEWDRFKEAWLARGLGYAPFGSPDDDDSSQRGLLYQVLDARPNDIVRWVKEAPKPTSRDVIAYIIERWHDIRIEVGAEEVELALKAQERRNPMSALGDILGKLRPEAA